MRLHNRVALITGGGGGIGKAIALKCAAEAKVMVVDVTQTPRGGPATLDVWPRWAPPPLSPVMWRCGRISIGR